VEDGFFLGIGEIGEQIGVQRGSLH